MAAIKGNLKERNRKSCQTNALGTAVDTACTNDNIYISFLSQMHEGSLQKHPEHAVETVSTVLATSFCHCKLWPNATSTANVCDQVLNSGQSFANIKHHRLLRCTCNLADLNSEKGDIQCDPSFPTALTASFF